MIDAPSAAAVASKPMDEKTAEWLVEWVLAQLAEGPVGFKDLEQRASLVGVRRARLDGTMSMLKRHGRIVAIAVPGPGPTQEDRPGRVFGLP